jgi:predicted RNase H-like HicB family nuclease
MVNVSKKPEEYLKEPYSRVIIPDEETGTYTAMILEFPGCISEGGTIEEAYELLEEAAVSWIEAALDLGQDIPLPESAHEYSGKIAFRLPRSLHRQAALLAERDGVSLNQFIVMAVAEKVGSSKLYGDIIDRLEQRVFQTSVSAATSIFMGNYMIKERADNLATRPAPYLANYSVGVN